MPYKQVLRSDKAEGREHLILYSAVSGWKEEFRGMILDRSKVQADFWVCVRVHPSPLFVTDVSQPETAPRGSSCLQRFQTHFRGVFFRPHSQRGARKSCEERLCSVLWSNCCAGGAMQGPWKALQLHPWPVAVPSCGHCCPEGLSANQGPHQGPGQHCKMLHLPPRHLQGSAFAPEIWK